MTSCLRLPQSLADAQSIIVACTGPDWRTDFVLGLGTVAFVGVLAAVVWLAVRAVWRP